MLSRIILVILCLVFIVLIGFFLIWPKYQKFSTLGLEIKAKETELGYIEEYFSKIKQLSQELKKYENQLFKVYHSLSLDSSSTLISLINFIQKASSQNGLIVEKIGSFAITLQKPATLTPDSPQPQIASKIKEMTLDLEVSGSYFALKNFINTLERSAKIIEVENISFSSAEKEEVPTFNLKIKTYSY